MIGHLERVFSKIFRRLSRSEWGIRLLGLPRSSGTESDPGLVILQVDGLSRTQLEAALRNGKMPFLKKLIEQEGYQLHTHFPGIPTSTPAIQGELFYGVKRVVPAFSFLDRKHQKIMRMFESDACAHVEKTLAQNDPGLLEGGSSYSNIFTGGAAESHFCPGTIGWSGLLKLSNPLFLIHLIVFHGWSLVRIAGLLILEVLLAVFDSIRGAIEKYDLWKEIKFIPARVAICILLRELIVIGIKMDVARGLPIIHANFVGYDEQAHRRGPSSKFAHWTLKGIDDAFKRIAHAAQGSSQREYDVWFYSDHGQEDCIPYPRENGRPLEEAVLSVFQQFGEFTGSLQNPKKGIQLHRSKWLGGSFLERLSGNLVEFKDPVEPSEISVAAMGPLGHIYGPQEALLTNRDALARKLAEEANIPMVMIPTGDQRIRIWTPNGEFHIPGDEEILLGPHHPFLKETAEEWVDMCHHPDSGDFVISGWRLDGRPITFPIEHGTHGGMGSEETRGFALLPQAAPVPNSEENFIRPIDLREGILAALERRPRIRIQRPPKPTPVGVPLRVMTYNVHSCIGMDGKISTRRIARIIAQYDPDIVALQELDVGRSRTQEVDQAHAIARELEMEFHFHPALQIEEELYGDALLSRYPMKLIQSGDLPGPPNRPRLETRGVLWVEIAVNGQKVQILNTHLGVRPIEQRYQLEGLLGSKWLSHPDCREPVILCGDFNASPSHKTCRRITQLLNDAQDILDNHVPQRTWFGRFPVGRIDHIFVGKDIQVESCLVPRTTLTRIASDHLPLIVDVIIPSDTSSISP
jgi:endonuclease/exonuclease/phosphatase family metal-dependent hydrolase